MATIESRLLSSYVVLTNVSGLDADVRGYLPLITAPGIFADLNYTTGKPTGWGGYDHCLRFSEMAAALFTPSSAFYNSAALRAALLDAQSGVFSWFLSAQPQDEANWWYQAIGCGRPIALVSLQLRASLSAAGVANSTALMDRSQWESFSSTGTNAADIALVHIGNGLLNGNRSMVAQAFAKIWSTVQYAGSAPPASPEGPKSDGSFMQHGAQLYLGNYGASWTKDVLSNIAVAANTSFNASAASLAVVTHVVLDGCARAIHWPSAQWDVAVIGRQVTGPGSQAVVGRVGGPDTDLLDPGVLRAAAAGPRAAELLALAAALENPASVRMPARFSAFYAADYAVQTRPEYFASVRMISARTAGGECINGQGLQSLHAADGVQYIMATGYEYNDIAPTWDWEMLPGTTVQRGGAPLTCKTADGMGAGTMTGVMSRDNATGVDGLQQHALWPELARAQSLLFPRRRAHQRGRGGGGARRLPRHDDARLAAARRRRRRVARRRRVFRDAARRQRHAPAVHAGRRRAEAARGALEHGLCGAGRGGRGGRRGARGRAAAQRASDWKLVERWRVDGLHHQQHVHALPRPRRRHGGRRRLRVRHLAGRRGARIRGRRVASGARAVRRRFQHSRRRRSL
jgi:hypothetical protein